MNKMMTVLLAATVAGVVASSPAHSAAAAPTPPGASAALAGRDKVEQQVIAIVKDWMDAVPKRDTARIGQYLANDFVAILWDGTKRSKAEYLDQIRSGKYAVEAIELEDAQARVIGDAAIVTFYQFEKSTSEGVNSSGGSAWTEILERRAGQWQVVAEHGSRFN